MTVTAANAIEPREPKYYLVKRHLLELIESLEPGALVPTERELTATLATSRTTVRQALGELVGEGRLVRRQGSGTYVAEPKMTWPLQMTSFTEQAAANGFIAGARLLSSERMRATGEAATRLRLLPGAYMYRIERLRLADDTPTAEETIETRAAPPREAALLGTDTGAPMLVLGRHSFEADGTPIEWVRSWYRGDRYTFVARLTTTG